MAFIVPSRPTFSAKCWNQLPRKSAEPDLITITTPKVTKSHWTLVAKGLRPEPRISSIFQDPDCMDYPFSKRRTFLMTIRRMSTSLTGMLLCFPTFLTCTGKSSRKTCCGVFLHECWKGSGYSLESCIRVVRIGLFNRFARRCDTNEYIPWSLANQTNEPLEQKPISSYAGWKYTEIGGAVAIHSSILSLWFAHNFSFDADFKFCCSEKIFVWMRVFFPDPGNRTQFYTWKNLNTLCKVSVTFKLTIPNFAISFTGATFFRG